LCEFFDSEACVVEQTDIREDMSPFSFNIGIAETVDFSNYIVGDRSYDTKVNYYVKGENGYVGGAYLEDLQYYITEEDDEDYYEGDEGYSDEYYDEYYGSYEGYNEGMEGYFENSMQTFTGYFQKLYRVEKVLVETNMGLFGGLDRTFTFVLDNEPTDEEKAVILEKINGLGVAYDKQKLEEKKDANDEATEEEVTEGEAMEEETTDGEAKEETDENSETSAEPQWNVKITEKVEEDGYTVKIVQKGSREEIQASSEALFGNEGDLYFTKDFSIFKIKCEIGVCDTFTLGDFVDYTTDDVDARYVLTTGFGSGMEYANAESAKVRDGEITIKEDVLYGVDMVAYGKQLNIWAIGFYLLIVVAVAFIVIGILKSGLLGGLKIEKKEKKAQEVTQQAARFCGNCGTKYEAGAGFCPECGTKLEG